MPKWSQQSPVWAQELDLHILMSKQLMRLVNSLPLSGWYWICLLAAWIAWSSVWLLVNKSGRARIQVVLKPVCLPIVITKAVIIAFSLWLRWEQDSCYFNRSPNTCRGMEYFTSRSHLSHTSQLPAKKEKQQCFHLLCFCPRFICNKKTYFYFIKTDLSLISFPALMEKQGRRESNNPSLLFSYYLLFLRI